MELAIVFIVIGLLITPFYTTILNSSKLGEKADRMQLIRSGLAEHMRIYGTYPCPAPIGEAQGGANYFSSNTVGNRAACANQTITVAGTNGADVYIGAVPIDDLREVMNCTEIPAGVSAELAGVFRSNLTRVKDLIDLDAEDTNYKLDKTDCLLRAHIIDEYGRKILYAVTAAATNLDVFDPFNPAQGNIRILDAADVQTTTQDQLFVIASHGEDGKGAVGADGAAIGIACGLDVNDRDNENCDGDATFRDAMLSKALGNNYYDDVLEFSLAGVLREDTYWHWAAGDDPAEGDMYVNPNVRVILDTPAAGVVPADAFVVSSGNVRIDDDGAGNDGDLTARDDITSNAGNIMAAAGDISAGVNVIADVDITADTGDIIAGTGITADVGDIRAPNGEVTAGSSFVSPQYCYNPAPDPCNGI